MLELETEARKLVEYLKSIPGHSDHYKSLQEQLNDLDRDRAAHELTIEAARNNHVSDDVEIDDDPFLSIADEGVWVSAWVWVPIETEGDNDDNEE
jgi:hypothetical protein